jgi:hypothetical protein
MTHLPTIRSIVFMLIVFTRMLPGRPLVAQDNPCTLSGVVSDPTGALIPNAQVSATDSSGAATTAFSDAGGMYTLTLLPGEYRIEVNGAGFQTSALSTVKVVFGRPLKHDVQLAIAAVTEQVRVTEESPPDTEPASNASAITLSGSSLESLADDPQDLTEDLMALAGPSAGPDGGEIYVDGFSGGKLPPKSSIREVRVNQNPFSAEYDRIGFGRIEILTKPGAVDFHGQGRFNFGDSRFYSRNPFAAEKPAFQRRILEGTVTGSLNRNSSFTLQFEQRNIG